MPAHAMKREKGKELKKYAVINIFKVYKNKNNRQ